ncbi:MAG: type II secretion system F family protein [Granulosicoccus sp.]
MFQTIYNVVSFKSHKLQRAESAMAFFQLSRMLSAGVSLSDALHGLATDGAARDQPSWRSIASYVSAGKTLSEALDRKPLSTDKTVIALLKAGEAGGQLNAACEAIYEYLQWHHELRQRLFTLLIYPLFSLCVLVGVTGFLFISVVPSIKSFLLSSGNVLEWHTVALIGLSSWMSHFYLPALITCMALALLITLMFAFSQRLRLLCDKCVLRLPIIGRLITDIALSRYARCCAQMYANGVALESSMELAEGAVVNRVIRAELSHARITMIGGASLADSMRGVSLLPYLFTRLIAVGEYAGQLAEVLTQIGEHQSAAAEASIKRLEQLIGPLLLMIVGTMLLWIVVSILAPVYNIAIATVVSSS